MKILSQMRFGEYLRYRLTPRGRLVTLDIHGVQVKIRKGTHDLGVALLSLRNELLPI